MYDSRKLARYSKPNHEKIMVRIKKIIDTLLPYRYLRNTINGIEYDFFEYHTSKEEDFQEWYIMTREGARLLELYSKILCNEKNLDVSEIRDKLIKFLDQIKNQIVVFNPGTDTLVYVDKTQPPIKDNPKALVDGKYIYESPRLAYTTGKTHDEIIHDIEYIKRTALPDISDQFCHCFTAESAFSYYIITQKGYDQLCSYWHSQEVITDEQ